MKAKALVLSAIICGASMLGLNFSTVYAATNFQTAQIHQNIVIEQLSQKDRDRNGLTGAGKAIAAIEAAKNKNKHKNDNPHEDYHSHRRPHHNPPPPPQHPMPQHHYR